MNCSMTDQKRINGWRLRACAILPAVCFLLVQPVASGAQRFQDQPGQSVGDQSPGEKPTDVQTAEEKESVLLTGIRQLTFEGRRAGEGYFSRDGRYMVFQSEREPGNPFFQIYLMDRHTGHIERISPGRGKTTCAWIHPSSEKILFASTHENPAANDEQRAEIELRQSGRERRYSWDYDEHFELYEFDRQTSKYRQLTMARGYDAEGSWSPDGELIAFTSNRHAYEDELTELDRKRFETDPAYMNDIYIMDADGGNVRRLTLAPGYDGGPFFSPDGTRICWRRFSPDGTIAEVWTMKVDGSEQRQLTHLGAMSWAPFYHPSGQYLIFTTNLHGFANFELYLIDVEGTAKPVRVTYTDGFDGLPAFTPDGNELAWTSGRTESGQSQLFLAKWNHNRALELLGLTSQAVKEIGEPTHLRAPSSSASVMEESIADARRFAEATYRKAVPEFVAADVARHVKYLCRDELEGRFTGTRGERLATAYVAAYMERLGLEPAGDDGSWFQPFEFTSGVSLGPRNELIVNGESYDVEKEWRPLSFSGTGEFESAPLVFAGYGIVTDTATPQDAYDSYAHLDVKDKWVVVFRYLPENVSPERRQQLNRPSQLRFKASFARERGARGLVIVTGPNAQAKSELVPLQMDGIVAGSSLPVISVTNRLVDSWLATSGKSLKQLQDELDDGKQQIGFEIAGVRLSAKIEVERIKKTGRNVLGRMRATEPSGNQTVVIGAHIDHLGKGASSASLARGDEAEQIHYGADDNASGVAALMEIAEYLTDQSKRGGLRLRRDLLFAAWSGEELGLLGSDHFVKALVQDKEETESDATHRTETLQSTTGNALMKLPSIVAYLNMDMVGRLDKHLILQGIGSSSVWRGEIERCNVVVGLPVTLQDDSYLPTDASSFYMRGIPVLSAFTGAHREYHTPRDTPDTLNYEGAAQVARLMGLMAQRLAENESTPDYVQQPVKQVTASGRLRAYLGTIPDYAEEVRGVLLSGVSKGGPADKAGVQSRDVIIELAGKKIENIYDYTHAIEGLKVGQPVKLAVLRGGKRVELEITPQSRE